MSISLEQTIAQNVHGRYSAVNAVILAVLFYFLKFKLKTMLKKKLKWLVVPAIAAVAFVGFSSFVDGGEAGTGAHGKCDGKNENKCVITDADGTVHNYTGAYISN